MILNLINKPFDHLIIPDFLTLEESTILFNKASKVLDENAYDNRTMFADRDSQQSSIGLVGVDMSIQPHDNALAIKIQGKLFNLFKPLNHLTLLSLILIFCVLI